MPDERQDVLDDVVDVIEKHHAYRTELRSRLSLLILVSHAAALVAVLTSLKDIKGLSDDNTLGVILAVSCVALLVLGLSLAIYGVYTEYNGQRGVLAMRINARYDLRDLDFSDEVKIYWKRQKSNAKVEITAIAARADVFYRIATMTFLSAMWLFLGMLVAVFI